MADDDKQGQPSMDEILSSIRRVDSSVEKDTETEGAVAVVSGESDGNPSGSGEQQEPSMDEILSSIRRVVSSEEEESETKSEAEAADPRKPETDGGDSDDRQKPSTDEILSSIRQVVSSGEESEKKTDAAVANTPEKTNAETFVAEKEEVPSMDEILSSIRRVVSSAEDKKTKNETDIVPEQLERNTDSSVTRDDSAGPGPVSTPSLQHQEDNVDIAEMKVRELGAHMMRPILLEWLNQNLPPMVEQLVRAEIERLKKETK